MRTLVGGCPAEYTLNLLRGKWKLIVLNQLFQGTLRYSELRRKVDGGGVGGRTASVTAKMLTQELRQMESDGLIERTIYAQIPPKVEYSLTPLGRSLRPVILSMAEWGRCHDNRQTEEQPTCYDEEFQAS